MMKALKSIDLKSYFSYHIFDLLFYDFIYIYTYIYTLINIYLKNLLCLFVHCLTVHQHYSYMFIVYSIYLTCSDLQ